MARYYRTSIRVSVICRVSGEKSEVEINKALQEGLICSAKTYLATFFFETRLVLRAARFFGAAFFTAFFAFLAAGFFAFLAAGFFFATFLAVFFAAGFLAEDFFTVFLAAAFLTGFLTLATFLRAFTAGFFFVAVLAFAMTFLPSNC